MTYETMYKQQQLQVKMLAITTQLREISVIWLVSW